MSIRKWVWLFWTTLLVGGIVSLIVGLGVQATDENLKVFDFSLWIWHFGAGMMYSVVSQMAFFAYLILNYFAHSAFRNRLTLWVVIQWLIVVIVFVDLITLRTFMLDNSRGPLAYSVLPTLVLLASLGIAYLKSKQTNFKAFTPTVFFVFVATIIAAVPALREDNVTSIILMVIPLFACNAWQVMVLHKLVKTKTSTEAAV